MGIISPSLLSFLHAQDPPVCSTQTHSPSPHPYPPLPPLSVANPPINLPQIHTIQLPLRNLPHHPRRPPRYNTKTRNYHIRRHHTPIQYPHIILDDRELANYDIGSDIDVRADERGFDDGGRANEDMVCDFERVVGELASPTSVSTPPFIYSFSERNCRRGEEKVDVPLV